jgi:hypothetical protein
MRQLLINITKHLDGRASLVAECVPGDSSDPVMRATYDTLADAVDQAEWMRDQVPTCEVSIAIADAPSFRIRISPTLANEYANRLPDDLPIGKLRAGVCELTADECRAVLADAEFNSDRTAVDVGPYGMPLATFNAYRALANRVRAVLALKGV